jgi:hypothetical protein
MSPRLSQAATSVLEDYASPSELEAQEIPDHDGMPVTMTVADLTKCGDGLSESMGIAPVHVPVESRVMVLVYATAKGHNYKRITEGSGKDAYPIEEFCETLKLEADGCLFIDPELGADMVAKHMAKVKKARSDAEAAKRAARGEAQLPMPAEDEDE